MEKERAKIEVTLQQVKDAVRQFELQLEEGIKRTVLLKEDQGINFKLLIPFLGGLPSQQYYMSRETYEIFAENEREIPFYLDKVQLAVDQYIYEHKRKPIVPSDFHNRVNVSLLVSHGYLADTPPLDFYLTAEEDLITHKKPD